MLQNDNRPIALFDSGIGGLTVLRALMDQLPNESFVYLGDTARLPYGSKSPQTIERYLQQNTRFLESRNVKAVVVACNSASTVLLGRGPRQGVPIYNVIEPGARTALKFSRNRKIGVLGTKATIAALSYVNTIRSLDQAAMVYQQACPLLVPLVEEGWEADPVAKLIVERYVGPLMAGDDGLDTLILGCTHYPVLKKIIGEAAGSGIHLVDGAEAVGAELAADLASGRLIPSASREFSLEVMTTDTAPGFLEVARRLMLPHRIERLVEVDISLPSLLKP
ncbi:MAG: glutamate racemase [Proteobacteria bacterium]|nr:MAG: glutamate racemase [Pseudomonadota bacterium]